MRYSDRYRSTNNSQSSPPWYLYLIIPMILLLLTMVHRFPNGAFHFANPLVPPCKPGINGCVWVNTRSEVIHYPGTEHYGGTREGFYIQEKEALAAGYHRAAWYKR